MELKTCNILGLDILVTDMEKTVNLIEQNIEQLRGKYICVGNVHTTVMAHDDPQYHTVQADAAFVLPDGGPLSGYSRKHGFPEAERVTGPDLMLELFAISKEKGYRHYFYGATEETLQSMKEVLERDYPGIQIAGMYAPPFRALTPQEDAQIVAKINEARPDFIWIGLGAPKQEEWMYQHMGQLQGVLIGVGAGFDYLAGYIKRAPRWMQRMSLEWLYRLLQDPKRLWRRYFTSNVKFICLTRMDKKQREDI